MSLQAASRPRAPIHRALVRFPLDRRSGLIGLAIAVAVVASMLAWSNAIWKFEASGVASLLRFSDTPFTVEPAPNPETGLFGGTIDGGATFVVGDRPSPIPQGAALAGIAMFAALSAVAIRWRRVPVPAKVLWILFAALGVATLWYTGFVSGTPPRPANSLTIGFQRGGLLAVMIACLLFTFEVFPVPGPLRIKTAWLAGLVAFIVVWSIVRMALVLSTVHHVGSWTFLYVQYLAGPMVDFLSVVSFYSLATHGLARRLQEQRP